MTTQRRILCTGGAGYIGSHTVIHLVKAGYEVTVLDNLSNASAKVMERLEEICQTAIPFHRIDLLDRTALTKLLKEKRFEAVIHYAGLKSVGESVKQPLAYYRNNVVGTLNLLEAMQEAGCKTLVFSSSATVYKPKEARLTETDALGPSNPYGQTKMFIEQILQDLFVGDGTWRISILRYFNPVGAYPSGTIGESPQEPMNLLPYIQQVAVGRRPHLNIFGVDWPTPDGTGVRDYIHVEDLAVGHVKALDKLLLPESKNGVCMVHNLGTGQGVSVLEMVKLFETASATTIPTQIAPSSGGAVPHCRRPGDLASVVADPSKAESELGWKSERSISLACESAWKWQSQNPYGYEQPQVCP